MEDFGLRPCPFCGERATIKECSTGSSSNGIFTASYKCGCDKCKIFFAHASKFTLECGQPKFICNGYDAVKDLWNRRASDG